MSIAFTCATSLKTWDLIEVLVLAGTLSEIEYILPLSYREAPWSLCPDVIDVIVMI